MAALPLPATDTALAGTSVSKAIIVSDTAVDMDDIKVRVLAYHRNDKDQHMITFRSVEHEHVRRTLDKPLTPAANNISRTSAGRLQVLPNELLVDIFLKLDMQSLFNLLHTSVWTRDIVTSMFQWRAVTNHALDALLALFRTETATHVTLPVFYKVLTEKECAYCGWDGYGGYLFLPEMARFCYSCITQELSLAVVTTNSVATYTKIPVKTLRQHAVVLKAVPGWYGTDEWELRQRTSYISIDGALEALWNVKGPDVKKSRQLLDELTPKGMSPSQNECRCRCTTIIPTYEPQRSTSYFGLSCRGCAAEGLRNQGRIVTSSHILGPKVEMVYSREGFLRHVKTCKEARKMWEASKGGTKSITHLESRFSINGGFLPRRMVPVGAWAF